MYFIIIAFIIILDQYIKYSIQANIALNHSIPIIEDIFHITYIQNSGAAFSILQNQTKFLIIVPLIVTILVIGYIILRRKIDHWTILLSMSFIAAGGIGNLIDRISYGYVVDFFDFRVFPIFNVADISVCIGCGLLLFYMFFVEPRTTKKRKVNMHSNVALNDITNKLGKFK